MTLPPLRTERLWLRAMAASDADDLHAARGDPECMRWWHSGVSPSLAATRDEIRLITASGTHWVFGSHGDAAVLGYTGFHGLVAGEVCGFGYLLRRDAWGQGLAAEASRAALDHGFGALGVAHAELWIDPGNARSARVAEKLGCTLRAWAPLGRRGGTELALVYGVTASEWRGVRDAPPILNAVAVLAVSDVPRALDLWCRGLGFRISWTVGDPPERGQVVARWTGGPGVRLGPGEWRTPVSIEIGADLEQVLARAREAGWTVVEAPAATPWGGRGATIADPDGNQVVLAATRP